MIKPIKQQLQAKPVHSLMRLARSAYNKLLEVSYTMCAKSAVNPTILMALPAIATQQSSPTEETLPRVNLFLDYMWTHPNAKNQE
jgi:hypothetical protein